MIVNIVFGTGLDRIVNFHNGSLVTASVTVIRSRKDGNHRSIVLPLITLHDQLMGSGNKV